MEKLHVPKYRWAKEVKALDENTCIYCGSTQRPEAHHVKLKSKYPDEETNLYNGVTLCHKCHTTLHLGPRCGFVIQDCVEQFIDTRIILRVPKGRLAAIKTYTESKGESVNGYINGLIRADMGFTEETWKEVAEDE